MENQNPQSTPAQDSSMNPDLNISQTPPPSLNNPSKRKFKIVLIGFFIIFFLTIGTAAAIYTFKEVSRNSGQPGLTPMPTVFTEISPAPTGTAPSTKCVVAGCSSQFCMTESEALGFVSTCEYTDAYACYKTAECKTQPDGKCGWTQTPELSTCLNSAR